MARLKLLELHPEKDGRIPQDRKPEVDGTRTEQDERSSRPVDQRYSASTIAAGF
jgi:hypothetical protein